MHSTKAAPKIHIFARAAAHAHTFRIRRRTRHLSRSIPRASGEPLPRSQHYPSILVHCSKSSRFNSRRKYFFFILCAFFCVFFNCDHFYKPSLLCLSLCFLLNLYFNSFKCSDCFFVSQNVWLPYLLRVLRHFPFCRTCISSDRFLTDY